MKLAEQLAPISGPVRLQATADAALRSNNMSPTAAKAAFLHQVMTDPGQILALFGFSQADLERRALAFLHEHTRSTKPAVPVNSHSRNPPAPHALTTLAASERSKEAARRSMKRIARVIFEIDGQDIREWTIGQCLTAGKRKTHEAYVLRVVGNQLKHLDHTKKVGEIMNDADLKHIVDQGRTYVEEG